MHKETFSGPKNAKSKSGEIFPKFKEQEKRAGINDVLGELLEGGNKEERKLHLDTLLESGLERDVKDSSNDEGKNCNRYCEESQSLDR